MDVLVSIVSLALVFWILIGIALGVRCLIRLIVRIVSGSMVSGQPTSLPTFKRPDEIRTPEDAPPIASALIDQSATTKSRQMMVRRKAGYPDALRTVLKSVDALPHVKQALLKDILASLAEDDSEMGDVVIIRHLNGTGWTWSEFDHWEEEFKKMGQWPAMWRSFGLDEEAPVEPASVDDALDGLSVAQLANWLRTYAPGLKPMPKKREELEQACRTLLAWEQIRESALARYQDALSSFRESRDEAKCRLLAHTLWMTYRTERDRREARAGGITRFEALPGGDDPVEQDFADRFNRGELPNRFPPFFPGDRCDLLMVPESD
jgi:hypothetical protein